MSIEKFFSKIEEIGKINKDIKIILKHSEDYEQALGCNFKETFKFISPDSLACYNKFYLTIEKVKFEITIKEILLDRKYEVISEAKAIENRDTEINNFINVNANQFNYIREDWHEKILPELKEEAARLMVQNSN